MSQELIPLNMPSRIQNTELFLVNAIAKRRREGSGSLITSFISYSRVFTCLWLQLWEQLRRYYIFIFIFLSSGAWIFNKEADLICVRGTESSQYEFLSKNDGVPEATRTAPSFLTHTRPAMKLRRKWFLIYGNSAILDALKIPVRKEVNVLSWWCFFLVSKHW